MTQGDTTESTQHSRPWKDRLFLRQDLCRWWWAVLATASFGHTASATGDFQTLEAERATLDGALEVRTTHAGFTGAGYADFVGEGSILWVVNVAQTALYQLEFRYALATGARPLDLLDEQGIVHKSAISFRPTGDFANWGTHVEYVKLEAGRNTLRMRTKGRSGPNVDHLLVSLTPPDVNRFLTFPLHSSHSIFTGSEEQSAGHARLYYQTIDPESRKNTFDKWKKENNFESCDPDDCAHAVYLNNVDLNLGRRMFVKTLPSGDVVSYVQNYLTVGEAVQAGVPIATVAMEYSAPVQDSSRPRFTKFYAFDGRGQRIDKLDLDGRGAKYVPGLCNVCHGGKPKFDPQAVQYPDFGDTGAEWIPWDLDAFRYDRSQPRSAQQAQFKRLNASILQTDPTNAAYELITGWYGGETMPRPTFDSSYIPLGWRNDADSAVDAERLYRAVVAKSCRTCHLQRGSYNSTGHAILDGLKDTRLEFSTVNDFLRFKRQIETLVYDTGLMPLARRTYELFWRSPQPRILDNLVYGGQAHQRPPATVYPGYVAFDFGPRRRPGRPLALIAGARFGVADFPLPLHFLSNAQAGATVRLNGARSWFASKFHWSFDSVPGTTVPELTGRDNAYAAFETDPDASSDIRAPDGEPYIIRFAVTNEFATFNELVRGRLFTDSDLQPLTFADDIYELLTTNFESARGSALSCVHCHSNSNVVSHANSLFRLRDFSIPRDQWTHHAFEMLMTRVNCHDPESSLIVQKPARILPHFGGRIFVFDGSSAGLEPTGDADASARILRWVREGAPFDDAPDTARGCNFVAPAPFTPAT